MLRLTAVLAAALVAGAVWAGTDPSTEAARGVRPALDHICARGPAEARDPTFVRRMSTQYGFAAEGGGFTRAGDDGRLTVTPTGRGCVLRLQGEAAMVADADAALIAFARRKGLTAQVTDVKTAGEEGRRIERERAARGRGGLTWTVFDDFNGRDRPSTLEGVWHRHAR